MNTPHVAIIMRKALAQNPNLLRTLIGMGLTLILLLAYAVYGATVSPSYYIFETESSQNSGEFGEVTPVYDEGENTTTWIWFVDINPANLTWVNLSASGLSTDSTLTLSSASPLFSHFELGDEEARNFSCASDCLLSTSHDRTEEDGEASIISLTSTDPARRGKGAVYAADLDEARQKAIKSVDHVFDANQVKVIIVENGNRSLTPEVSLTMVNEELIDVSVFEVDAATEFLWALAAVIGCFSMVLVPSFTIYIAAAAREKRTKVVLEKAEQELAIEDE